MLLADNLFSVEQAINGWSDFLLIYKLRQGGEDGDKGEDQLAKASKDKELTMIL